MAAPMKIPHHHVKQEFCENRPAYREGRRPKAMKVYTINQESIYLLVQGVPSLGATQELVKLFALYGTIEEYRILDEYPTADQYTDVFLFKYKKIQSSRFAKRKLDDWSFLGGVLHVSYAPEFESIDDTRQKLQERRRVIAARIRLQGNESSKSQQFLSQNTVTSVQHDVQSDDKGQGQSDMTSSTKMDNTWIPNNNSMSLSNEVTENHYYETSVNEERSATPNLHPPPNAYQPQVWLPPPPSQQFSNNFKPAYHSKNNYEFARVPSAHATLHSEEEDAEVCPSPQNFSQNYKWKEQNEYLHINNSNHLNFKNLATEIQSKQKHCKADIIKTKGDNPGIESETNSNRVSSESHIHVDVNNSKERLDTNSKQNTDKNTQGLVIRKFKKLGATPKFVPRQTLKIIKQKETSKEKLSVTSNERDNLNKKLRENAFVLGEVQGPVSDEHNKTKVCKEEESVNKSMLHIRKRVSMFSSDSSIQEMKKKK